MLGYSYRPYRERQWVARHRIGSAKSFSSISTVCPGVWHFAELQSRFLRLEIRCCIGQPERPCRSIAREALPSKV